MTNQTIRTKPAPLCTCCQSEGTYIYRNLKDRLFGVAGEWQLKKCNNKQCGLVWQDPMPIEEDLHIAYQTYYTHNDDNVNLNSDYIKTAFKNAFDLVKQGYLANKYGYLRKETSRFVKFLGYLIYLDPPRRAFVESKVFYLPEKENGKLLEIGFGSGEMLRNMKQKGWDVQGLDFDASAVKNAQSKGLNVSQGNLLEQNYADDSFDAIVMSHVLEHIPNPKEFLSECHRVLKPRGKLVSITPNAESLAHKIFKMDWRGLEPPRHLNIFTIDAVELLLKEVNFSKVLVGSNVRGANGMAIESHKLKYKLTNVTKKHLLKLRLFALIFQYIEWMLCKFKPSLGEELLLIATK